MTVFIELVTDAFEDAYHQQLNSRQSKLEDRSSRAGSITARRPVRGIEIKDDTYAFLRVVLPTGVALPILDSSSGTGQSTTYTNFILQSVQEARMERHQIVETFGDSYIFFFGESPRFLDCNAVLINSHDFNWRAEWWHNYETYLRGTKLVELGARCYMFWDDIVVEGYMLQAQAVEQSQEPIVVNLSFKFFVTKYNNVSISTDPARTAQFPISSSVQLPDSIELRAADSYYQLQTAYRNEAATAKGATAVPRQIARTETLLGSPLYPGQSGTTITSIVRQMPPSFLQDPAVYRHIVEQFRLANPEMAGSDSAAIRSLIADNKDEYVKGGDLGAPQGAYYNTSFTRDNYYARTVMPYGRTTILGQQETENLEADMIRALETCGATANNPYVINDLGLGPNFTAASRASAFAYASVTASMGASAGAGFSMGASATASFSPVVGAYASVGASASVNAGAGVSASATAGYYANAYTGVGTGTFVGARYVTEDPLGAVYGRVNTQTNRFYSDRYRYVEGSGDYNYGYGLWASFGGIGYGKVGYGDFGGSGFGSCRATGDPGFRDPELFTYAGVANSRSAYSRFVRTRNDQTAMTRGPVFGNERSQGAASVSVVGQQSAFSIIGVEGTISQWARDESMQSPDGSIFISRERSWSLGLHL